MVRAGIIGATGYVGIELVRILEQHPEVTLTLLATESQVGRTITQVYPHLKGLMKNITCSALDIKKIIENCDVIFLALPHGNALNIVPSLLAAEKKVIDLGPDFRLRNPKDYQNWYGKESSSINCLNQAVYGLPEAGYREAIQKTSLIANPGCYATAAILATIPALKAKIIDPAECIFDGKSGISGAGRGLNLSSHFCEATENITPYQIAGKHRHTPEIEQELSIITQSPLLIQFTPHLTPLIRGLLITAYFKLIKPISSADLHHLYKESYQNDIFILIANQDEIPATKQVRGTNFCNIGIHHDTRTQRLVIIAAIDNLIKGAAGQAVQNMNLMYQFPETTGLINMAIYP
jgi:N-acetyl-gamma-glutamyl-phosphate reductase